VSATKPCQFPANLAAAFASYGRCPAKGSEAELLIVEPPPAARMLIAKLYASGICPARRRPGSHSPGGIRVSRSAIRIGPWPDGHAYELLEYCVHGSLRGTVSDPARWLAPTCQR